MVDNRLRPVPVIVLLGISGLVLAGLSLLVGPVRVSVSDLVDFLVGGMSRDVVSSGCRKDAFRPVE